MAVPSILSSLQLHSSFSFLLEPSLVLKPVFPTTVPNYDQELFNNIVNDTDSFHLISSLNNGVLRLETFGQLIEVFRNHNTVSKNEAIFFHNHSSVVPPLTIYDFILFLFRVLESEVEFEGQKVGNETQCTEDNLLSIAMQHLTKVLKGISKETYLFFELDYFSEEEISTFFVPFCGSLCKCKKAHIFVSVPDASPFSALKTKCWVAKSLSWTQREAYMQCLAEKVLGNELWDFPDHSQLSLVRQNPDSHLPLYLRLVAVGLRLSRPASVTHYLLSLPPTVDLLSNSIAHMCMEKCALTFCCMQLLVQERRRAVSLLELGRQLRESRAKIKSSLQYIQEVLYFPLEGDYVLFCDANLGSLLASLKIFNTPDS
eukprot:GCRY01000316.1.p1 GENE.GCRY01000316.1~~GCRY01000316.1.p1  ORF type:complete len:372 (-),score=42.15 GCRY01000316.1:832-1947(-)